MITAELPPEKLQPFKSWPEFGMPEGWMHLPWTEEKTEFYRENGFCVLDSAVDASALQALHEETVRICRGELGEVRGVDTNVEGLSDDEVLQRYICIHFPHKISALMLRTLAEPSTVEVLTNIIGPDVKCMQSMLFIKSAGKPGQHWHQDEFYIPTRDRSLVGAWIALDDATVENGCLWVIPGSHKAGILWPQKSHDDNRFDCAGQAWQYPYRDEDAVPVEVKAGSIVFFNGYLLHGSMPNRAKSGYRRALVNHYMSAQSFLPWIHENKWIAPADHRDIVMVAGRDPYEYKGTIEHATPHIRQSREGGCGNAENNKKDEPKAEKA